MNINTLQVEDLLTVDVFCSTIPSTIEGYYNGYTSNALYNDDNGAYMVKYFNDETVRMLYMGKVKDGNLNDNTGDASSYV